MSRVPVVDFPHPLITEVGEELDLAYLEAIAPLRTQPALTQAHGSELSIIFSSLHGTGTTMVPKTLKAWGFSQVEEVASQATPDGAFPTVVSPNPEEREALSVGIGTLLQREADLFLATDPDADRIGVVVRHNGSAELLTGNQIASLCLQYLCDHVSLPENGAFVKTLVTTELFRKIAEAHHMHCCDTLPGFKYIAECIREWEKSGTHTFLFGGEESYGYLFGDRVRDKDAVICCALLCEAALVAKREGKTLVNRLHELYQQHGVYREALTSVHFPETRIGREEMQRAMEQLRDQPPTEIAKQPVVCIEDYLTGTRRQLSDGAEMPIELPQSNILVFWLADESKAVVRPSGTEPKVKIYAGVTGEAAASCDEHAQEILFALKRLLSSRV